MKQFAVKEHAPSLLPDGEWKLAWAEEFDGTELDRSRWDYRLSMMGQRWPSWTDSKDALYLDGQSNAVFKIIRDPEDGHLCCAQLQTGYNFMDQPTKRTVFGNDDLQWPIGKLRNSLYLKKYGYFECRCRLQKKEGWWSAFWLQSPIIGATLDPMESGVEIDAMECFHPGKVHHHNIFTGGYGEDSAQSKIGGKDGLDTEEFHSFGVLWDETGYTFYIDGEEDGKITDKLSAHPLFILISTEVRGYRMAKAGKQPIPEAYDALDDDFLVDHIRVFDRA